MNQTTGTRSKAFKQKENIARENVRARNEQELVGDLTRLLDEKLYCDITFVVENQDFPAHIAILQSRVPKFCQHFVPGVISPDVVQSCICIQHVLPEEFSAFLRLVYTENKVSDFNVSDFPWRERVSWIYPGDDGLQEDSIMGINDSIEDCYNKVDKESADGELNMVNGNPTDVRSDTTEDNSVFLEDKSTGSQNTEESLVPQSSYFYRSGNYVPEGCCKLGADLLSLVNDSSSADICFILNGSYKIHAHRAILCARSNYFSAMLYGGWSECGAHEIPLQGVSPAAFFTVLHFLYGGVNNIPCGSALLCDLLPLADMYCLDGLKEVIKSQLTVESCHLFHKPCTDCISGVMECLEISEMFNFTELKQSCIRWITKYYDKVLESKCFAVLSRPLQEEILVDMQNSLTTITAVDSLKRTDRLQCNIPHIKWAEPIHVLLTTFMDYCLNFIALHFPVVVQRLEFLEMLKGVGWSAPLLDNIFSTVKSALTVDSCCEAYKVAARLSALLSEETESDSNEEISEMVGRLRVHCQEYIASNLHRVSHTEGWSHLSPRMQAELRKSQGSSLFFEVAPAGNRYFRSKKSILTSGHNSTAPLPKGRVSCTTSAKGHSFMSTAAPSSSRTTRPPSARNTQGSSGGDQKTRPASARSTHGSRVGDQTTRPASARSTHGSRVGDQTTRPASARSTHGSRVGDQTTRPASARSTHGSRGGDQTTRPASARSTHGSRVGDQTTRPASATGAQEGRRVGDQTTRPASARSAQGSRGGDQSRVHKSGTRTRENQRGDENITGKQRPETRASRDPKSRAQNPEVASSDAIAVKSSNLTGTSESKRNVSDVSYKTLNKKPPLGTSKTGGGTRGKPLDAAYVSEAIYSAKRSVGRCKNSSDSVPKQESKIASSSSSKPTAAVSNTVLEKEKIKQNERKGSLKGNQNSVRNKANTDVKIPENSANTGESTSSKKMCTSRKAEESQTSCFYDNKTSRLRRAHSAKSLSSTNTCEDEGPGEAKVEEIKRGRSYSHGQPVKDDKNSSRKSLHSADKHAKEKPESSKTRTKRAMASKSREDGKTAARTKDEAGIQSLNKGGQRSTSAKLHRSDDSAVTLAERKVKKNYARREKSARNDPSAMNNTKRGNSKDKRVNGIAELHETKKDDDDQVNTITNDSFNAAATLPANRPWLDRVAHELAEDAMTQALRELELDGA